MLERAELADISEPIFENRRHLLTETPHAPAIKCALWLTEGKRHQVKRMFEAVGCTVVWLRRTEFAGIALDETLNPGEYRPLNAAERTLLGAE